MAPDTLAHTTNRPLKRGRKFLNTPGPTNVPPRVLNAMHRDTMDLNDPEFVEAAVESSDANGAWTDAMLIFSEET